MLKGIIYKVILNLYKLLYVCSDVYNIDKYNIYIIVYTYSFVDFSSIGR